MPGYTEVLRSGLAFGPALRAVRIRKPYLGETTVSLASVLPHRTPFCPTRGKYLSTDSLPRIVQPSFWKSLVPKPLRPKREGEVQEAKPKKKEWNPATFFIVMVMFIGSQAIQMISLRQSFVQFSNQTEAKLAKLREVVEKIQKGEEVDVEGILETGSPIAEREWEEVIRELEQEDEAYRRKRRRLEAATQQDPGTPDAEGNDVR